MSGEVHNLPANAIAIIGMAGRFPGARTAAELWALVRGGHEAVRRLSEAELRAAGVPADLIANPAYVRAAATLDGMDEFDAGFFGFSPRDASIMDPQHRHFLECAWEALESAGYTPEGFAGSIGVFGGCGMQAYFAQNLLNNPQLMASAGYFLVRHTGNDKDFLTTRVSYQLNLTGPSVSVQTACSTSLVAVHVASQSLLNRECDMALAGGVTIEIPHGRGYLYEEGEILSPDGHCRAFDAASKGTVFGSGVGLVVLRRLEDAIEAGDHIHAVIIGSAVNNDGAGKVGYLAPSVDGQAAVVAEAIALAGISPESITYVETHGTGTPVGDPIEVAALTEAFGRHTSSRGYCGIGSIKTNIGHLDTAAGVASLIKAASAIEHAELPPSLHYERPNPTIPFEETPFYVNAALQSWNPDGPRRAGVTSLGVGGTNAHVVLEQAPERLASTPGKSPNVIVLSARSEAALDAAGARLGSHLAMNPTIDLGDLAHTLQVGRRAFDHRRVLVCRDTADAVEALRAAQPKRLLTGRRRSAAPSVVFLFPGGGAQYPDMGREIYEREPVYREEVDRGLRLLRERHGIDLKPLLFPDPQRVDDAARELERSTHSILSVFIVEHALGRLWMSWGVQPAAMTGHSLGEYAAACLAGVFSFEDALTIVKARGDIFERLPAGAMLSVPLAEADVMPWLTGDLALAAVNAPALSVVSGPVDQIDALEAALTAREIESRRLHISVAAHSAMLEPHLAEFGERVRGVRLSPPSIPFISNVSGQWADAGDVTRHDYWVRHLRRTVRFSEGLATILEEPNRLLIEVGPGTTLGSLARMHATDAGVPTVLASMRHPHDVTSDLHVLYGALGQAWIAGVTVDWPAFQGPGRRRVPLPTYPFERQRYWVEPTVRGTRATQPNDGRDVSQWLHVPVWTHAADLSTPSGLEGTHWLLCCDPDRQLTGLSAAIAGMGGRVTLVQPGTHFAALSDDRFQVSPYTADFKALFDTPRFGGTTPSHIVVAWRFGGNPIDAALLALLELGKSVLEAGSAPLRLMVLTESLQRVHDEAVDAPEQALVAGAAAVLVAELPSATSTIVDLTADEAALLRHATPSATEVAMRVVGELSAASPVASVAHRDRTRWVPAYRSLPATSEERSLPVKDGGVYLLTGGLGGLALELAEALARTARVTLVLVGRRGLPPVAEWPVWTQQHPNDDRTGAIRKVQKLEALGATVIVLAGDVTRRDDVHRIVADVTARVGRIDGVVHAAGMLDDGLVALKSAEDVRRVIGPKVAGVLALADALEGTTLDFWVNCSSVSSLVGLPGQFDYAAGNAFLDAFSRWRRTRGGAATVAVNWQAWRDVGMLKRPRAHDDLPLAAGATGTDGWTALSSPLLQARRAEAGGEAFALTLSTATHWIVDEHRLSGGEALLPGTAFLEIAIEASQHALAATAVEISELLLATPLRVDAEATALRVEIERASGDLVMTSGPSGTRLEHVRGSVRAAVSRQRPRLDLEAVSARCRTAVEPAAANLSHLKVGAHWRCDATVQTGHGEALVRVTLPAAFASEIGRFTVHPAALDVATACGLWLVDDYHPERDFFVPLSYGRVIAHAPMTATVACHVRRITDVDAGADVATFDITVADARGEVLVEVERFVVRRLAPVSTLGQQPSRTARAGVDLSEAITPGEGRAAFLTVLRCLPLSQVVVGPRSMADIDDEARRLTTGAGAAAATTVRTTPLVAPRDDVDTQIAAIWRDLLGASAIGIDDNFFELGGHSLLLAQVGSRIRRATGVQVPVARLFEHPTIRHMADYCRHPHSRDDEPALVAVPREQLRRMRRAAEVH